MNVFCKLFFHTEEIRIVRNTGKVEIQAWTKDPASVRSLHRGLAGWIADATLTDVVSAQKYCARCNTVLQDYLP